MLTEKQVSWKFSESIQNLRMAGPPKSRGMIMYVLKNMMDSFKVSSGKCSYFCCNCYFQVGRREKVGTLMGKDPFGNSYYELPAQPQVQIQPTKKNLRRQILSQLCTARKADAYPVVRHCRDQQERGFPHSNTYLWCATLNHFLQTSNLLWVKHNHFLQTRWWECTNLLLALTPTFLQNGKHTLHNLSAWNHTI